jgi:ElaB/YqjD/DUF883 family membrane-anchored ribosome-binding protein
MPQPSPLQRIADLERLLRDVEHRLSGLSRMASRSRAPRAAERVGDSIASAFTDLTERLRGRARVAGEQAHRFELAGLGDEMLTLGNDALRRLTREVEQRPLVLLAVAAGVGALAAGLLARR